MDKQTKDNQIILAVPTALLFPNGKNYFQGFSAHSKVDFQERILTYCQWLRRGDIEEDPGYKHPIPYAMIVNPKKSLVFSYQRAKGHDESRLAGKWSWGVGGHVDSRGTSTNPLAESMLREVNEEVDFADGKIEFHRVLGYINDDSNAVGKVHFGILSVVETDATLITPKDSEIFRGEFKSVSELEKISQEEDVENWSRIALEPLRDYLSK